MYNVMSNMYKMRFIGSNEPMVQPSGNTMVREPETLKYQYFVSVMN